MFSHWRSEAPGRRQDCWGCDRRSIRKYIPVYRRSKIGRRAKGTVYTTGEVTYFFGGADSCLVKLLELNHFNFPSQSQRSAKECEQGIFSESLVYIKGAY